MGRAPGAIAAHTLGLAALALLSPASLLADGTELLPEVSLHLKAARYAPSDPQFGWDGWIGGGFGLVKLDRTTLYLTADVETILGSEKRTFDANQANYHLEPGVRVRTGGYDMALFYHHVSRHLEDRDKSQAVDWNMVGVRVSGPLPEGFPFPGRYSASVGHTVQVSFVGYRWEVRGQMEATVLDRSWGRAYLSAEARLVTTDDAPSYPRGDFLDFAAESGVRFVRGGRRLDLFAAFEHRNDVFLLVPGAWDRALFGFRVTFAGRE